MNKQTMAEMPGGTNYCDVLFKLAHGRGIGLPVFDQTEEQGPPHCRTFTWSCKFFNDKYSSEGHGRSKKEAKNAAAKNLITQLDLSQLPEPRSSGGKRQMQPMGRGGKRFRTHDHPGMMQVPGMGHFGGMRGGMGQRGPGHMMGHGGPPRGSRPSWEDGAVMAKHGEIYPQEEELERILSLVNSVELALKQISDELGGEATEEGSTGEKRLCGMARVGDLAKCLLLSGDTIVMLVIMCSKLPTVELLETVSTMLTTQLAASPEPQPWEVAVVQAEAGLRVSNSGVTILARFTSTLLRNPAEENADSPGGTELLLEREPGLIALAELRRTKWFSAMATPLPSCVELIRILESLGRRQPDSWGLLAGWGLQLLVERALFSVGFWLSPSRALMRVLEVVASGLLLPGGSGLRDPCEREPVSPYQHLTDQQREDITKRAQQDLRNLHFGKIVTVLGADDGKSGEVVIKTEDEGNAFAEDTPITEEVKGAIKTEMEEKQTADSKETNEFNLVCEEY